LSSNVRLPVLLPEMAERRLLMIFMIFSKGASGSTASSKMTGSLTEMKGPIAMR